MSEKIKISYDAKSNMLQVNHPGVETPETLPIIPETFMRYGCDQILEHFRKDHPVWADDFNNLLREAIQGSSGIKFGLENDGTFEQIKAVQLAAFINTKYLIFTNQVKSGIKPDLGRA